MVPIRKVALACCLVSLQLLAQEWAKQEWAKRDLEKSPRHQEWVDVSHGGRALKAFVVHPESKGKTAAVILIHENVECTGPSCGAYQLLCTLSAIVVFQRRPLGGIQLGRDQPGANLQKLGPNHGLPKRRVPSRVPMVQRIHFADCDRHQERDFGTSGRLQALSRSHQQYPRSG